MSLAHLAALPQNRDMDEPIPRVREVLSTTPVRWEALAGSIQLELLRRRPTPDDWSALECLQHILDTEIGAFGVRLAAFMDGRDLTAFDPDAADFRPELTSDPSTLAARFAEARARNLAALAAVVSSDMARTANHPEYGQVTLHEMLNEWAGHDLMHTVEAERALMQSFVVGSGKWRGTFADHDAEALG